MFIYSFFFILAFFFISYQKSTIVFFCSKMLATLKVKCSAGLNLRSVKWEGECGVTW